MKFFMPLTTNDVQAERIHRRIADRLKGMGRSLSPSRVSRVVYERDGKMSNEAVGSPSDNGEIVLAIFKDEIGYNICTYSRGVVWGNPMMAHYSVTQWAELFD
jgi:hypothetical protein